MSEKMTLRHQVGQLIIAGLEGTTLTAVERAWLRLLQPGGIILFRRNIEDAGATLDMLRQTTEIVAAPLLRAIDIEGGLVDRLRDLIAPLPSVAAVAATGNIALFRKHGTLIGREAKLLGFNTVLAPVVDLASPESQPVMRTRVASSQRDAVADYAEQMLKGLEQESVASCLKHFPGLGGGTLDSHLAMPVINRSWNQLWNNDLVPYRRLTPAAPMVMISHACYPAVVEGSASISRYWIREVLRRRIGFMGLIVSDDLEMGGILSQCSIEEAAVLAIAAGTDMIEICKDPSLVLRAHEATLREAETSAAFRRLVQAAARRIEQHKQRRLQGKLPRTVSASSIATLSQRVNAFAGTVAAGAR